MNIGDQAPDLLGLDEQGNELRLSQFRGQRVVLYFYPKDNTPGCTAEACSFRDHEAELAAAGYAVVGVSADSAQSHVRFRERHGLPFHLVADTQRQLIEAFGAWGEKKLYGKVSMGTLRKTFIFNAEGLLERIVEKVDTKNHTAQIL